MIAIDLPDDGTITVAGEISVNEEDEVMLLTTKGQRIRTRVREIRETGRGAKGVKLLNLAKGDSILTIARIVETEEEQQAAALGEAADIAAAESESNTPTDSTEAPETNETSE